MENPALKKLMKVGILGAIGTAALGAAGKLDDPKALEIMRELIQKTIDEDETDDEN